MTTTPIIDLLSLIEQRAPVRLKHVASTDGGEYTGNCPWCGGSDRFHVWPHSAKRPHFWCRGCAQGGDAINFLMEWEHMDFREACQELDIEPERAHMPMQGTPSPLDSHPFPCSAWQSAAEDFIYQAKKMLLRTTAGRPYLDYLLARGISLEMIDRKNIGYVPLLKEKWIETPFSRWGLTEDMLTPDQWAKGRVRVPDGLLFPHYGEDGKPWKLSMYRPLAQLLPEFKRGLIVGSKECLLNEHLFTQDKPIIMTEAYLDAISIEQEAGDLIVATSTDGTNSSRSLRCQAKLQYAPFVLQAFDNDDAGMQGAVWWSQHIKNCIFSPIPHGKDPNEMLISRGSEEVRAWVSAEVERIQTFIDNAGRPAAAPAIVIEAEPEEESIDVCFLCHGELHSYTSRGTPCCEVHYSGRQAVELAMDAFTEQTIQQVSPTDPLLVFAKTIDTIAGIFAPCAIHRDPPGYSLQDHVSFLNDEKRRKEIAYEISQRRIQEDRRYKHLHPDETIS